MTYLKIVFVGVLIFVVYTACVLARTVIEVAVYTQARKKAEAERFFNKDTLFGGVSGDKDKPTA